MRKRLYDVLTRDDTRISEIYDAFMLAVIGASLIPLFFRDDELGQGADWLDGITVTIFILDYLARWATADLKLKKGWRSFVLYPFTPFAIIDLLTILPSLGLINPTFKTLRVLRALKALRVLKALRFSKYFALLARVIAKQSRTLISVGVIACGYVFISALIMFNVEPDHFDTFFEAVYWATTALTTVGYGDIYPVTVTGKVVSMLSSFMGIAVVALPSGIFTAGFMSELERMKDGDGPT
jgi:voltage-gated potassium channel